MLTHLLNLNQTIYTARQHFNKQLFILVLLTQFSSAALAQTKLWDQTYGGNRTDNLQTIIKSADGGFLVGGTSLSDSGGDKSQTSRGKEDYWVVKTDANGNKQWDRTFGGDEADVLTALVTTPDGYLLAGTSYSGISGDKTEVTRDTSENRYNYYQGDFWVIKINLNGEKIWDKRFGGQNKDKLEGIVASGNNFVLGGTSGSGAGGDKTPSSVGYWVVKMDANGNKLWDNTIPNTGYKFLNAIVATADGNVLLSGSDYESGYTVKVDNEGNKIWEKYFRENFDFYYYITATVATPDGGFLLGGDAQSTNGYDPNSEYWVVKIDKQGNTQWSKTFKGAWWPLDGTGPLSTSVFSEIVLTPDNQFLLAGYTIANKGNDKSEPSFGTFDYWVLKINNQGDKIWDRTIVADSVN